MHLFQKETKEEQLEATRRRMSSFPPSDGDESMMILERIHYLSTIEMDEQSRCATPVSETPGPLSLLRKSLCLPTASSSPPQKWNSAFDVNVENSKNTPKCTLLAPSSPNLHHRRSSSPCVPDLNALRSLEAAQKNSQKVVFPKGLFHNPCGRYFGVLEFIFKVHLGVHLGFIWGP